MLTSSDANTPLAFFIIWVLHLPKKQLKKPLEYIIKNHKIFEYEVIALHVSTLTITSYNAYTILHNQEVRILCKVCAWWWVLKKRLYHLFNPWIFVLHNIRTLKLRYQTHLVFQSERQRKKEKHILSFKNHGWI